MRRITTAVAALIGLLLGTLVAVPASLAAPDGVATAATTDWTIAAGGTLKGSWYTYDITGGYIDDDGTGTLNITRNSKPETVALSNVSVTGDTMTLSMDWGGTNYATQSGKPLQSPAGANSFSGQVKGGWLNLSTATFKDMQLIKAASAGPLTFSSGDFPDTVVGTPVPLTVTVTNTGAAATPSAITVAGAGVTNAGTGTCAVNTVIPEHPGSCTVDLTWNPSAPGSGPIGLLTIAYPNGVSPSNSVTLTGKATAPGTPGPLTFSSGAFPQATVGTPSPLTVTVTNNGTAGAVPSAINATGPGIASVAGGTCAVGTTIPSKGSCTQMLTWTPAAAGRLTGADLEVVYPNGAAPSNSIPLTGDTGGVPPSDEYTIEANGSISIEGESAPIKGGFIESDGTGQLLVDFDGETATLALSNIDVQPTTLTGSATFASITFSTQSGKPLTSAAGAYKYGGDMVGTIEGTSLTATVEDLTLIQAARPGPLLFSSGQFPNATVGAAPSTLTVTVSNSGGVAATPSAINVSGDGVANAGTGTCATGTAIAAHPGSCTVDLTWTPTADGPLHGELTIAYPGGTDATDSLQLTGEATGGGGGTPGPLSYSSGAFEPIEVGETDTLTVTVTNQGSAAATPSAITASGPGVAKADGGTCAVGTAIAADASCTQMLTWTPTAAGPLENGDLVIAYPGGVSASSSLVLTGEASEPTPPSRTTLKVNAVKKAKKLKVGKTTKVVKSAKTNAKIKKVKASCLLNGKTLSGKHKRAACSLKTKKTSSNAKVWAKAKCSTGLKVRVKIVANAKGMNKKTWSRTWKVKNDPRVSCTIHGNG